MSAGHDSGREVMTLIDVDEEIGGIRILAGLLDALHAAEAAAGDVAREEDFNDVELDSLTVHAALADGREIHAVRLERASDGLTFHLVLLTEEDL